MTFSFQVLCKISEKIVCKVFGKYVDRFLIYGLRVKLTRSWPSPVDTTSMHHQPGSNRVKFIEIFLKTSMIHELKKTA